MVNLKLVHELRELGVGWQEIIDTVDEATDNTRKLYAGWLEGIKETEDNSLLKNAKTLQGIRLARKQLGIERSINNEEIRDIALHKTFSRDVLEAIENVNQDEFIAYVPQKNIETEQAHIFTMSDFHYNGDISDLYAFDLAFSEIIKVVEEKGLEEIYLFELGDIIEGAGLRTSQLMAIKKGMVEQIIDVANKYVAFLKALSKRVVVHFYSLDSSNHTQLRNLGTKQNQLVEEDLMIILNEYIKTALPDLDITTGKDIYTEILGFKVFIAHGHLIRSKEKYLETVGSNRNILIDYGFFGHFHHQRTIDLHSAGHYDKKVFYVPSMCIEETSYEQDKELSSLAGIGYYVFDIERGNTEVRKLLI